MRLAIFMGCGLYAITAAQAASKSMVVGSVRGPVSYEERGFASPDWPGVATVQPDLSKADLELKVWLTDKVYNLEALVDVSQVDQAILPVDENGGALATHLQATLVPWIKVSLPGQPTQVLDVRCNNKEKICRGFWPAFPFDPQRETRVTIEVNLRGLEGKHWSLFLNRFVPQRQHTPVGQKQRKLEDVHATPPVKTSAFERRLVWDLAQVPGALRRLEEWDFAQGPLGGPGFHRLGHETVFEILEGAVVFDFLYEKGLESLEMGAGTLLRLPAGTIHALRSPGARVRRLEFQ